MVIRIRNLLVQAGQRVLLEIPQLQVQAGERVAVIGPNGAGKSTLLRILGGMGEANRGSVQMLGRSIGPDDQPGLGPEGWRVLHAQIGQVMQGLHLVSRLTARENVILGALARPKAMPLWCSWMRLYPEALRHEADLALRDLGVLEHADMRTDQLSGGERQKVSIARLRLQRPRLILADEPTSALDPSATGRVCKALCTTAENATLLSVVHSLDLLPLLADRVLGLVGGRVVLDQPVAKVELARLEQLYVQAVACEC